MRWLLHLSFLITPLLSPLLLSNSALSVIEADKPATIKVLLARDSEGALVEVRGPHMVFNPHDGRLITTRYKGRRYWLSALANGIKWGDEFQRIHQIRIVPKNARTTILVDGIQYRGCVDAYLIDGKISLVNEIDVENYLKSTLTSQVNQNVDDEVMDALTIAARTNAYYISLRNPMAFWHVDASRVGYHGQGLTLLNSGIDRSVNATRYLIMLHEGLPFATGWTDNCAGRTASYSSIYRKKSHSPSGVMVPIAERERKNFHWCFSIAKDELAKLLRASNVTGIDLYYDDDSSKVYAARIKEGTQHKDLPFSNLQEIIGKAKLISNDFSVKIKNDQILFEGYGKGDGVGLCLYSANLLSRKGELAPKILAQFFPQTHIEKVRSYEQLTRQRVGSEQESL